MKLAQWLDRMAASKRTIYFLFLGALATRSLGAYLGGVRGDDADGIYLRCALNFLAGRGLMFDSPLFGPTYSWLPPGMSFIYILFIRHGHYYPALARAFFVLLSSSSVALLFPVAKRLLPRRSALLAAIVWILYPPQWLWGSRVNPHTYAMDMVVVCLYFLFLGWERQSVWLPVLTGALWTSVTLARGEYAFGLGAMAFSSLFVFRNPAKGLACAALLWLGWGLAFAPWVLRNYRLHHHFILIGTAYGDNFWKSYNPRYEFSGNDILYPPELLERLKAEKNEVKRAQILTDDAKAFIKTNPSRAVRNVAGNLLNFWRPWLSPTKASLRENIVYVAAYGPVFILFVVGLFLLPYREPAWMAVAGLILYKVLIHIPFYVIVLFREGIMTLIILVAMIPVERIFQRCAGAGTAALHER